MIPKTLYAIDDDEIFLFMLRKNLRQIDSNIKLETFSNAVTAREALQANSSVSANLPDVIFLDINMPVMDGWEFLDAYSGFQPELAKDIIIYMISSSHSPEDIEKSRQYDELSGYIIKPVKPEELKFVLEKLPREPWVISSA